MSIRAGPLHLHSTVMRSTSSTSSQGHCLKAGPLAGIPIIILSAAATAKTQNHVILEQEIRFGVFNRERRAVGEFVS